MNIIKWGILFFIIIETLNVIMLYFAPGMKQGNALGVFTAWDKCQKDEELKSFANYMAAWVAGAKLIFILLGISVILWGNIEMQIATCGAMVISISSFFYKLYPGIREMDKKGQINPAGYSKTLLAMIVTFILGFLVIFIMGIIKYI
jgi:hypothetical protein